MSSTKVSLVIRIKLSDGSRRYCPPVTTPNGKLKAFYAQVNGKAEHHAEGVYALRYRSQGRLVYESLGSDPAEVLMAQKKEAYLHAAAAGLMIPEIGSQRHPSLTVVNPGILRPLKEAIIEYLAEIKAHKSRATDRHYTHTLTLFLESCKKQHLEELDRKDVMAFMTYLRTKGNAPRTVANRVGFLKTFMLSQGLKWPLLKSDKPRYTDKVIGAYDQQEIRTLLAAANQEEYELIQFFLCTGARNKEVEFATWSDVNFFDKTFTVKEKLDLGFTPKDKEEGAIPIPDSLVTLLRERRKRHPFNRMIFSGPGGTPNNHFLRILKRLALRAGLNCGQCYNKHNLCCSEHPVCSYWELHRLRKTYATMHHEAGVPVRTIQRWLRHSDLETTLRYLAGSDDKSERTGSKSTQHSPGWLALVPFRHNGMDRLPCERSSVSNHAQLPLDHDRDLPTANGLKLSSSAERT